MKLPSVIWSAGLLILWAVLIATGGLSQSLKESQTRPMPPAYRYGDVAGRAYPRVSLGSETELKYVGTYTSDGKFRAGSTLDRMFARNRWATAQSGMPDSPEPSTYSKHLLSSERLVEDFEPPKRAVATAKKQSTLAETRDRVFRFLYGRGSILRGPSRLTTDSKGRLIISDPAIPAVHVLDGKNKVEFSIIAGRGHRLLLPSGTAVDHDDNIYVADAERGLVLVYGPDGTFLRHIGLLAAGEGLFHRPTSIAIDRAAKHLYVLDSPRLFMLDLDGHVLQRIGKLRGNTGPFDEPTDIALTERELLVIDAAGTRVQMMDLDCNLLRVVKLSQVPMSENVRLAADNDGNIYASFANASTVKIYNHEGNLLAAAGHLGIQSGEFNVPTGLWVDASGRIYVADTRNARVQVFQLGRVKQ